MNGAERTGLVAIEIRAAGDPVTVGFSASGAPAVAGVDEKRLLASGSRMSDAEMIAVELHSLGYDRDLRDAVLSIADTVRPEG
jgi:hypothetical protein